MGLCRGGEVGFEFGSFLRGHGGELPKVVAEDAPLDPRFAVCKTFASQRRTEVGVLEDADASFGAAPALVAYEWALRGMGKLGWIAAFIYCAGAALRLARFNTNIDVVDKRYFQGLPSPAAAARPSGS